MLYLIISASFAFGLIVGITVFYLAPYLGPSSMRARAKVLVARLRPGGVSQGRSVGGEGDTSQPGRIERAFLALAPAVVAAMASLVAASIHQAATSPSSSSNPNQTPGVLPSQTALPGTGGRPDITEFAIPTSNAELGGIARGPDGAVWFTESHANKIGRATTTGVSNEFSIPTADSGPTGIAPGLDGAVWFTESGAGKIGRITGKGIVTEFNIPTRTSNPMGVPNEGGQPLSITAGPDKALWFTEAQADKIGRITTTGMVSEFPLPSRDRVHASPEGITAGADGGLWFTESLANKVGRIDANSHAITEFLIPGGGGAVVFTSIVLGPDGAMWYPYNGSIGRITTNGNLSQFPAPFVETPGGEAIVRGADNALWFTEVRANRIGRMNVTGQVNEFPLPTSDAGVDSLTLGPDNAIWFTEANANKIGRIQLPA